MRETVESNGYELLPSELQAVIDEAVDLFSTVWLGAECYHTHRGALGPGCPEFIGTDALERGTLVEAADRGLRPCGNCSPNDYRRVETDGGRTPRPGPKRAELGEQLVEHDAVVCDVCDDEVDLSSAESGLEAVELWDDHVRDVHDDRPVATDGGADLAIRDYTFHCDGPCDLLVDGVPWAVAGGTPAGDAIGLDADELADVCDECMERIAEELGDSPEQIMTDGGQQLPEGYESPEVKPAKLRDGEKPDVSAHTQANLAAIREQERRGNMEPGTFEAAAERHGIDPSDVPDDVDAEQGGEGR